MGLDSDGEGDLLLLLQLLLGLGHLFTGVTAISSNCGLLAAGLLLLCLKHLLPLGFSLLLLLFFLLSLDGLLLILFFPQLFLLFLLLLVKLLLLLGSDLLPLSLLLLQLHQLLLLLLPGEFIASQFLSFLYIDSRSAYALTLLDILPFVLKALIW